MPENIEIPVVHRAQQALRLRFLVQGEAGMNRANGVIKFFQQIIRIVRDPSARISTSLDLSMRKPRSLPLSLSI